MVGAIPLLMGPGLWKVRQGLGLELGKIYNQKEVVVWERRIILGEGILQLGYQSAWRCELPPEIIGAWSQSG